MGSQINTQVTTPSALCACSTAMDVAYSDELPEGAELLEGSLQASFPKLAVGSTAKHSYVVRFNVGRGKLAVFLPAASVAYLSDSESTLQVCRGRERMWGRKDGTGVLVCADVLDTRQDFSPVHYTK